MSEGYVDFGVAKKCYNPFDSYGEICVHCNCCGRFDKATMYECRLATDKRQLAEDAQALISGDFPMQLQQNNILKNIEWHIKRIRKSEKALQQEAQDD